MNSDRLTITWAHDSMQEGLLHISSKSLAYRNSKSILLTLALIFCNILIRISLTIRKNKFFLGYHILFYDANNISKLVLCWFCKITLSSSILLLTALSVYSRQRIREVRENRLTHCRLHASLWRHAGSISGLDNTYSSIYNECQSQYS